jgi:hypothetical protein
MHRVNETWQQVGKIDKLQTHYLALFCKPYSVCASCVADVARVPPRSC